MVVYAVWPCPPTTQIVRFRLRLGVISEAFFRIFLDVVPQPDGGLRYFVVRVDETDCMCSALWFACGHRRDTVVARKASSRRFFEVLRVTENKYAKAPCFSFARMDLHSACKVWPHHLFNWFVQLVCNHAALLTKVDDKATKDAITTARGTKKQKKSHQKRSFVTPKRSRKFATACEAVVLNPHHDIKA